MKSCKDCVHFVDTPQDLAEVYGKVSPVPGCMAFGYILGNALHPEKNEDIQAHFASTCESYSTSSGTPVEIRRFSSAKVANVPPPETTGKQVQTCLGCKHLVKPGQTVAKLGLPFSYCSKYGEVVTRPPQRAQGCDGAEPGVPLSAFPGRIDLLTPYRPDFQFLNPSMVAELSEDSEDPRFYESDKEVSDEDRALGIRAWRLVSDPEGDGQDVFLPIFDDSQFTESEKLIIPQHGSDEHPEVYKDYAGLLYQFAVDSWTLDETLCLVGEPGLGKTEFGRWVAYLMQVPFRRFSFHKSSDVDDMIGKMKFHPDKGTYWVDGRMTLAYQRPGVILADELNLAPNECKELLRSMMDNSKQLVLDQDEGIVVTRNPLSRMIVAINPSWDVRNIGAEEFADAEVNRMSFSYVGWPPEAVEREIIRRHCALVGYEIPDELLTKIIRAGQDIRAAAQDGNFPGSWGIRQQVKVAKKTQFYGLARAFKQGAFNYYDPEVVEEMLAIIRTI